MCALVQRSALLAFDAHARSQQDFPALNLALDTLRPAPPPLCRAGTARAAPPPAGARQREAAGCGLGSRSICSSHWSLDALPRSPRGGAVPHPAAGLPPRSRRCHPHRRRRCVCQGERRGSVRLIAPWLAHALCVGCPRNERCHSLVAPPLPASSLPPPPCSHVRVPFLACGRRGLPRPVAPHQPVVAALQASDCPAPSCHDGLPAPWTVCALRHPGDAAPCTGRRCFLPLSASTQPLHLSEL